MSRHIAVIQGHPDPAGGHFCHALADAYADAAKAAGHTVKRIEIAAIDFPLLRTAQDFHEGVAPASIREAQEVIRRAEHMVIVYPLWLGTMPALLKGFFEQTFRPGFSHGEATGKWPAQLLTGRSARIVITMGMPVFIYRWFYFAHSLRSLERNILRFAGIKPVRQSLFGMIEAVDDAKRLAWLDRMAELGARGQ